MKKCERKPLNVGLNYTDTLYHTVCVKTLNSKTIWERGCTTISNVGTDNNRVGCTSREGHKMRRWRWGGCGAGKKDAGGSEQVQEAENYMEVMSLRAWSSSSLMALYFSFWAYNSSIGGRVGWREGGVVREGAWVKGRHDKEVKGWSAPGDGQGRGDRGIENKREKKGKQSYTRKWSNEKWYKRQEEKWTAAVWLSALSPRSLCLLQH